MMIPFENLQTFIYSFFVIFLAFLGLVKIVSESIGFLKGEL